MSSLHLPEFLAAPMHSPQGKCDKFFREDRGSDVYFQRSVKDIFCFRKRAAHSVLLLGGWGPSMPLALTWSMLSNFEEWNCREHQVKNFELPQGTFRFWGTRALFCYLLLHRLNTGHLGGFWGRRGK
jgi:hypothetical protein